MYYIICVCVSVRGCIFVCVYVYVGVFVSDVCTHARLFDPFDARRVFFAHVNV